MTINPRRRLSARAASTVLVGLATACAYFAFSPVNVARAETTTSTSTSVSEVTSTTGGADGADDSFGQSGTVDPTPITTTPAENAPPTESTTPTSEAPPSEETTPTSEAPPSGTTTPTTLEETYAPRDVIEPTTTLLAPAATAPQAASTPPASAPDTPTTTTAPTTTTVETATTIAAGPAGTVLAAPPPETMGDFPSISGMTIVNERSQTVLDDPVRLRFGLPGQDSEISIEVRPSRLAAAWLLWVTISLFVVAFWLPSPARRMLGSSVPSRRRA